MDEMTKFAGAVPGVLHEAAALTRKLASANLDLVRERDEAVHQLRLTKLAQRMHERGIDPHLSFDEKVAHLGNHEVTKIAALEMGLSLVGGGLHSLGQLEEKTAGEAHGASTGLTQEGLNDFILNLGGFDR